MEVAEASNRQLTTLVEEVLRTNQNLDLRMRRFETEYHGDTTISPTMRSISRSTHAPGRTNKSTMEVEVEVETAAYEKDLQRSRVYRRTINKRQSMTSLASTAMYTTAMSLFSKVSLSQVSSLSFYVLPIYRTDLSNGAFYNFEGHGRVKQVVIIHQNNVSYERHVPYRGGHKKAQDLWLDLRARR